MKRWRTVYAIASTLFACGDTVVEVHLSELPADARSVIFGVQSIGGTEILGVSVVDVGSGSAGRLEIPNLRDDTKVTAIVYSAAPNVICAPIGDWALSSEASGSSKIPANYQRLYSATVVSGKAGEFTETSEVPTNLLNTPLAKSECPCLELTPEIRRVRFAAGDDFSGDAKFIVPISDLLGEPGVLLGMYNRGPPPDHEQDWWLGIVTRGEIRPIPIDRGRLGLYSAARDSSGRLWVGGIGRVQPAHLILDEDPPRLVVEEPVFQTRTATLPLFQMEGSVREPSELYVADILGRVEILTVDGDRLDSLGSHALPRAMSRELTFTQLASVGPRETLATSQAALEVYFRSGDEWVVEPVEGPAMSSPLDLEVSAAGTFMSASDGSVYRRGERGWVSIGDTGFDVEVQSVLEIGGGRLILGGDLGLLGSWSENGPNCPPVQVSAPDRVAVSDFTRLVLTGGVVFSAGDRAGDGSMKSPASVAVIGL